MSLDISTFRSTIQTKLDSTTPISVTETLLLSQVVDVLDDKVAASDVIASGDAVIATIQTEGTTQTGAVTTEGTTQISSVQSEGAIQVAAVQAAGADYVSKSTSSNQSIAGDLTILGNLTIQGTTTSVNQTSLSDTFLILNGDFTDSVATQNAGVTINRGGESSVSFFWDESNDRWSSEPHGLKATSFIGPLTGNADTASTLANPREIGLSGDVIGTINFDGSSDVTINSTVIGKAATNGDSTQDFAVKELSLQSSVADVETLNVSGAGAVTVAPDWMNHSVFHIQVNGPSSLSIDLGSPSLSAVGKSVVIKVSLTTVIPLGFPGVNFGTAGAPVINLTEHFYFVCIDGTQWIGNRFHSSN